jgi:hypothetical protein
MFSKKVSDQLKYYVYRLIDPRNGETFYVGKGKGDRVFFHAKGVADSSNGDSDDMVSQKIKRIREILNNNLEVIHIIHRHGLDENTAFEVEAALIDVYPEATNIAGGRGSYDRGVMNYKQIIALYDAPEAVFNHKAIIININQTADERESIYEAVRYAWIIDSKRASKAEVVLAAKQGLIIGVFVADKWIDATISNFPGKPEYLPGRKGFIGKVAPTEIADQYLQHRLPDDMRKKGAANPIKYTF